jgi:eukaryotic-like serine/threonine-protein kinase
MSEPCPLEGDRLTPADLRAIVEACDCFEEEWLAGRRPRAEDFLGQTEGPARSALLHDLLELELHYRRKAGEDPAAKEYRERLPGHAGVVDAAFAPAAETAALDCGTTPPTPLLPPPQGQSVTSLDLPGYEVLGEVGRGGMGVVYKARQVGLKRTVALKMVLAGAQAGPLLRARFRREAEVVARLHHPHIVEVHEIGEHRGCPYFSLEFVDGPSLAQTLQGMPQPARQAARLVETLARAVHHAHRHGVVHRDLKPANVLLAGGEAPGGPGTPPALDRYTPKVTDFGLAKRLDAGATQTESGAVVGTPSYMAPEQAQGKKDLTTAVDVYALGAILYELLTGRPPFRAATPLDTVLQVLADEPVPPRRLQPKVPVDLETVCLKCLEKEPKKRYASAEDLAEDLRAFLEGRPIRARPVGPLARGWRWCRRNPALASLAAAVVTLLLALAGGASLAAVWLGQKRDQALDLLGRAETAERERTDQLWHAYLAQARAGHWSRQPGQRFDSLEALRRAAAIRPSLGLRNEAIACLALADLRLERRWDLPPNTGTGFDARLERYAQSDSRGNISIRRVRDHREVTRLPGFGVAGSSGSVCPPLCFSPDGRRLAATYAGPGGVQFVVWDVRHARPILKVADAASENLDFSPDGRWAAFGPRGGAVVVHDLTTGKEFKRLSSGLPLCCIRFHPGGRKLAVSGLQTGIVQIWDLDEGRLVRTLRHPSNVYGIAWHPRGRLLAVAANRPIYLWDADTGERPKVLEGHLGQVLGVAFSPGGDVLASYSWDGTTRLWDPASGQELVRTVSDYVKHQQFSADGRRLRFRTDLSPSGAGVWEVATGRDCFRAFNDRRGAWGGDFSPNGRLLALAHADGVRLWDVATGEEVAVLPTGPPCSAFFHPDGRSLFTSGTRGALRWPLKSTPGPASEVVQIGPPENLGLPGPNQACLDAAGRVLAVGERGQGRVVVLDLAKGTSKVLPGVHPNVAAITISADGRWVATGTVGGSGVKVWDLKAGRLAAELPAGDRASVLLSPDGRWLAVGGPSDGFRLWEVGTWRPGQVRLPRWSCMAFTPDGRVLALCPATIGLVTLVDPATGREFATLESPNPQPIGWLRFSRDGTRLAAGWEANEGQGGTQVWDLRRVREHLTGMGLDWDLPPYPPARPADAPAPLRVRVLTEARRPDTGPGGQLPRLEVRPPRPAGAADREPEKAAGRPRQVVGVPSKQPPPPSGQVLAVMEPGVPKLLGLSPRQREQIRAALDRLEAGRARIREALRPFEDELSRGDSETARDILKELRKKDPSFPSEMTLLRDAAEQVERILTPEQRARLGRALAEAPLRQLLSASPAVRGAIYTGGGVGGDLRLLARRQDPGGHRPTGGPPLGRGRRPEAGPAAEAPAVALLHRGGVLPRRPDARHRDPARGRVVGPDVAAGGAAPFARTAGATGPGLATRPCGGRGKGPSGGDRRASPQG